MKERFNRCDKLPRRLKKTLLKYCVASSQGMRPKECMRLEKWLNQNRNLADVGDGLQTFVSRCLRAVWYRGGWDSRLFD